MPESWIHHHQKTLRSRNHLVRFQSALHELMFVYIRRHTTKQYAGEMPKIFTLDMPADFEDFIYYDLFYFSLLFYYYLLYK